MLNSISVQADEDVLGTVIGEAGSGISQGQRQLLGLARAFLHPSPLLFVDEASSQLDHCSEVVLKTALQQHLDSVKGGVTMLMIAHRKHGLRELCNMVQTAQPYFRFKYLFAFSAFTI